MSDSSPSDRIARLAQAASRHAVRHADGCVVWRRFGQGPPLVLLHGGHGSWLHWARNVEALGGAFELWVPDLPGYGDSTMPAEPTMQAMRHNLLAHMLCGDDARADPAHIELGSRAPGTSST